MTLLNAALLYAESGYPVFPCVPDRKIPMTPNGCLDATTDPATIETWWTREPNANIGLRTDGLLVIDVDGASNPWPGDERAADLAICPCSLTPRGGRHYVFRQNGTPLGNTAGKLAPNVDTRSDHGYILVAPSKIFAKQYEWAATRELLDAELTVAPRWILDALLGSNGAKIPTVPGDVFDERGAIPEGKRNATLARLAGVLRRPGCDESIIYAALSETNRTKCHPPLPDDEVRRIARSIAKKEPDQVSVEILVGGVFDEHFAPPDDGARPVDPGPIPESYMECPGFMGRVIDLCLSTAPYPSLPLAFAGAVALQGYLCGRKVRTAGDLYSNVYVMALARSGTGKEWPRKVNALIADAVGSARGLAERAASGEGLEDVLSASPCVLLQTDEIDTLLRSITKSRDGRMEFLLSTLLRLSGSASSPAYAKRIRANQPAPEHIPYPCLSLFGTAVPEHFYSALPEQLQTNGLIGRMLIVEAGKRGRGVAAQEIIVGDEILEAAAHWSAMGEPQTGPRPNLVSRARVVPATPGGARALAEIRHEADDERDRHDANGHEPGCVVLSRVAEHTERLALLYAVAANYLNPEITPDAVLWAGKLVKHQAQRLLFMMATHAADTPFDAMASKVVRLIAESPNATADHSKILRKIKIGADEFAKIVRTLRERGEIEELTSSPSGRTRREYRLAAHRAKVPESPGTFGNFGNFSS